MPLTTVLLPTIQTFGFWEFKEPFHMYIANRYNVYTATNKLTLISVMSMKDMELNNSVNAYQSIYNPVGLSELDYQEDYIDDVPILTFSTNINSVTVLFRIPLNYVSSVPGTNDVVYRNKAIVLDLGKLPETSDLSIWDTDFKEFTLNRLGVTPLFKEVQVGEASYYSEAEHSVNESLRSNLVTINDTNLLKFNKLKINFDELKWKHEKLIENYNGCRATNPFLTNYDFMEYIVTNNIVTNTEILTYITTNNTIEVETILTNVINTNTVTTTQLINYIRDNDLLTGQDLISTVPLEDIQNYVDTSQDALIESLLNTIYLLSSGTSSLTVPVIMPSNLEVNKGGSVTCMVTANVPDGTKYYWDLYKTDGSVKLFKVLSGEVTMLGGSASIHSYVQSIETVDDTPVFITLRMLPGTPNFLTITPKMSTIEHVSSEDNYAYVTYLKDYYVGYDIADLTASASDRTLLTFFLD